MDEKDSPDSSSSEPDLAIIMLIIVNKDVWIL